MAVKHVEATRRASEIPPPPLIPAQWTRPVVRMTSAARCRTPGTERDDHVNVKQAGRDARPVIPVQHHSEWVTALLDEANVL